jgi:hypothetical protein
MEFCTQVRFCNIHRETVCYTLQMLSMCWPHAFERVVDLKNLRVMVDSLLSENYGLDTTRETPPVMSQNLPSQVWDPWFYMQSTLGTYIFGFLLGCSTLDLYWVVSFSALDTGLLCISLHLFSIPFILSGFIFFFGKLHCFHPFSSWNFDCTEIKYH